MERNWEVIQNLLRAIEDANHKQGEAVDLEEIGEFVVGGRDSNEDAQRAADLVIYNFELLLANDFLTRVQIDGEDYFALTWEGHNLLDELRGEETPDYGRVF